MLLNILLSIQEAQDVPCPEVQEEHQHVAGCHVPGHHLGLSFKCRF